MQSVTNAITGAYAAFLLNGSIPHFPLFPLPPLPWGWIGFGRLDKLCPRIQKNFLSFTYCFPRLSINIQVLPCLRNFAIIPSANNSLALDFSQDDSQTSCLSLSFSSLLLLFCSIFFHNIYECLKYAFVFFYLSSSPIGSFYLLLYFQ